ncbi:MAG TPA: YetF domain-containing protein [Pseudonocardiaceae bacterium]|nr:YetF domain-containing protein [Pseudonocardiaceae bacterium]
MHSVIPTVWSDLFGLQVSVLDKVLRTVLVYAGLAILLRVAGKRDLAQLNTFDLVVMLLLSNVVQNAIIGPDNSLTGGLIGAALLIAFNALWVRVVNRRPRLTAFFEGTPTTLVENGRFVSSLHRLGLRRADIAVALRKQGAASIDEVAKASLEPGGSIVVDLKPEAQDVTVGDFRAGEAGQTELIAQMRDEIRRLSARVDEGFAGLHQ